MNEVNERNWKTLAETLNITGIPESTLRRFFKRFSHYLESKKVKGRRYFSQGAVETFQMIRELSEAGKTREEIEDILEESAPKTIDTTPVYQSNVQPDNHPDESRIISVIEKNTEVIKTTQSFTRFLMEKCQEKSEEQEDQIRELKEQVAELKDRLKEKDQEMEDRILIKVNEYLAEIVRDWKK